MRLCRRHIESRTGSPIVNKETQKKMPARRSRQSFHQFALLAAAAMALLAFVAAPAAAAPSLAVELDRDEAQFPFVRHGDERVDYTLAVGNVATVESGAELTCNEEAWGGSSPSFAYQWLRNGADISGAESATYTLQPADDQAVVQCRVTATNGVEDAGGGFAGSTRTTGSLLVEPPTDTPMPPVPPASIALPGQSGTLQVPGPSADRTLSCNTPVGDWTAVSEPLEFQWYRNGVAIPGANEQTYAIAAGSLTSRAAFQCAVTGSNDIGSVTRVSAIRNTSPAASPAAPNNNNTLFLSTLGETSEPTSGLVTVELELPDGAFAFRLVNPSNLLQTPVGWSCDNFPPSGTTRARVHCTRSDVLIPGQVYSGIGIVARLGDDMPDVATATAVAYGGGNSAPVGDEVQFNLGPALPFGLSAFDAEVLDDEGNDYTQAGGHPFVGIGTFEFNKKRVLTGEHFDQLPLDFAPVGQVRQVVTDLPRGFVGNALAVPQLCATVQQVSSNSCPAGSRVGGIELLFGGVTSGGGQLAPINAPIYAIEPEFGTPAQFAFKAGGQGLFTLSARLRPDDGYGISLELAPAPQVNLLYSKATICDWGTNLVGEEITCKDPEDAGANAKPLFANPTRCGSPPPIARAHLDSWQNPGADDEQGFPDYSDPDWKTYEAANPEVTGCEQVGFDPGNVLTPSSSQADSASGLDIELTMPTNGLEGKDDEGNRDPEAISQANVKRAEIAFPPGMAVNASAAEGLGACSAEQIKLGTNAPVECPDSSKIGTVEIETPIIEDKLEGGVYIAEQGDVDGSLIGLYMVFDSPENGILIKIPGKVEPQTDGQLVAVVDEIPDAPFSTAKLHFPGGQFATLLTPPKCGSYEIVSELTPWSGGAPVVRKSSFEVTSGPGGGPCPDGALKAMLNAGVSEPVAGKTSPFSLRLWRDDGSQRFSGLDIHMPLGLTGYLKGVEYCPQATIDSISSATGTGQAQIGSPSCPAASQVGTVVAGAGAGANPFFVESGKAYLAGPYKGAPLSIVATVPAVAGPLDLGTVVVRNAVYVDPVTAQIDVVSDPVPTILHGLLLDVRDIRVSVNRPNFMLNPTNCEMKSVGVDVRGEDGGSQSLSKPFRVGGCRDLGFKPRVNLRLFGGVKRGKYQGLRAVVRPRPGDANIKRAALRFPRSAFVAQEHIRTVCTRVQFKADACPKGAIYGRAIAYSPLLDYPLRGNVYLRSSDNPLPDVVADLRGPDNQPVRVDVATSTDSVKGALRSIVQTAPDAPVSYFRLQLFGGKKGLIVNSRNICRGSNKMAVRLSAHNNRRAVVRPNLFNSRCKKQRRAKRKKNQRHARRAALRKNLRAVR